MEFLGPRPRHPKTPQPPLMWTQFEMGHGRCGYTWSLEISLIGNLPSEPYIKTSYQFILTSIIYPWYSCICEAFIIKHFHRFKATFLSFKHYGAKLHQYSCKHMCVIRFFHVRVCVMPLHSTFVITFKEHCIIINNCRSEVYP